MKVLGDFKYYLKKYKGVKWLLLYILFGVYLLLSEAIGANAYWLGNIPCFFFIFIQMLTEEDSANNIIEDEDEIPIDKSTISWSEFCFIIFGSLFLSVVILNPICFWGISLLKLAISDPQGFIELLQSFPLFQLISSPIFWIVLPLALINGAIIGLVVSGFASKNDKFLSKFIYWMKLFQIPMVILTVFNLWNYYKQTNNLFETIEDNLLSILAFGMGLLLFTYNWYKERYKDNISLSYFIVQSVQFVFFITGTLTSLYFMIIKDWL